MSGGPDSNLGEDSLSGGPPFSDTEEIKNQMPSREELVKSHIEYLKFRIRELENRRNHRLAEGMLDLEDA